MRFKRNLDLYKLLQKKSFFLLGPRSTGKSFLIRECFDSKALNINLNKTDIFLRLLQRPSLLSEMIAVKNYKYVVIDEIQKIPSLLDEVHDVIETQKVKFLLTGSSARKLKRANANMLGGRASYLQFHPLTSHEIPDFDIVKYLNIGGIPRIYTSKNPESELDDYIVTYLEEEIKAEAQIRNLEPFSRFLRSAATTNAQLINYSNISSDCSVSVATVREYYQVLQDTLIGTTLEPWLESKKRKAIQTSKFYFFDCGVTKKLQGLKNIEPRTAEWGNAFEHLIFLEIRAYLSYTQKRINMNFWRSTSKHEVDLILDDSIAIEIKATQKITSKHFTGFNALKEENLIKTYYMVSEDTLERKTTEKFHCIHWTQFLKKLWAGEII